MLRMANPGELVLKPIENPVGNPGGASSGIRVPYLMCAEWRRGGSP